MSRSKKKPSAPPVELAPHPQLQCWMERLGDLHLAINEAGARMLVDILEDLATRLRPRGQTIPLEPPTHPGMYDARPLRVFRRLHVERVDDPARLQCMYAGSLEPMTATILLAPSCIREFIRQCRDVEAGTDDFGFGPKTVIATRAWRKLKTLDRQSGAVWFWRLPPIIIR